MEARGLQVFLTLGGLERNDDGESKAGSRTEVVDEFEGQQFDAREVSISLPDSTSLLARTQSRHPASADAQLHAGEVLLEQALRRVPEIG